MLGQEIHKFENNLGYTVSFSPTGAAWWGSVSSPKSSVWALPRAGWNSACAWMSEYYFPSLTCMQVSVGDLKGISLVLLVPLSILSASVVKVGALPPPGTARQSMRSPSTADITSVAHQSRPWVPLNWQNLTKAVCVLVRFECSPSQK